MLDELVQKTEMETSENTGEMAGLCCEAPGDVSPAKQYAVLKEKTCANRTYSVWQTQLPVPPGWLSCM